MRISLIFYSIKNNETIFFSYKYFLIASTFGTLVPSIRNRVLCSGMLLYLHIISNKIFFHPAKFDNFKDETISDYKTVSVPQSQILAGLKTGGLVGL